jgi:hypothetical protein
MALTTFRFRDPLSGAEEKKYKLYDKCTKCINKSHNHSTICNNIDLVHAFLLHDQTDLGTQPITFKLSASLKVLITSSAENFQVIRDNSV